MCLVVRAAVLSHASYRRPAVQREILQLGGIPLMLSQCQVGALHAAVRLLPDAVTPQRGWHQMEPPRPPACIRMDWCFAVC
jgi:hypothetical protein